VSTSSNTGQRQGGEGGMAVSGIRCVRPRVGFERRIDHTSSVGCKGVGGGVRREAATLRAKRQPDSSPLEDTSLTAVIPISTTP